MSLTFNLDIGTVKYSLDLVNWSYGIFIHKRKKRVCDLIYVLLKYI